MLPATDSRGQHRPLRGSRQKCCSEEVGESQGSAKHVKDAVNLSVYFW